MRQLRPELQDSYPDTTVNVPKGNFPRVDGGGLGLALADVVGVALGMV